MKLVQPLQRVRVAMVSVQMKILPQTAGEAVRLFIVLPKGGRQFRLKYAETTELHLASVNGGLVVSGTNRFSDFP